MESKTLWIRVDDLASAKEAYKAFGIEFHIASENGKAVWKAESEDGEFVIILE